MKTNKVTLLDPQQLVVKGEDALKFDAGTLIQVKEHITEYSEESNKGDVLIRTESNTSPFVNLSTGALWGNSLCNYTFERVIGSIKIEQK